MVNVIQNDVKVIFNFRYSTETTHKKIKTRVLEILDKHHLDYDIEWQHSGFPFLTPKGDLVKACIEAVKSVNGIEPKLSTSGGTSDGRFISQMDTQVVELGPLNTTIHQVNERVFVDELENLRLIYHKVLKNILI